MGKYERMGRDGKFFLGGRELDRKLLVFYSFIDAARYV